MKKAAHKPYSDYLDVKIEGSSANSHSLIDLGFVTILWSISFLAYESRY